MVELNSLGKVMWKNAVSSDKTRTQLLFATGIEPGIHDCQDQPSRVAQSVTRRYF